MSTSGESKRCDASHAVRLPPEWEARPARERVRAVGYAPPERHRWIRRALGGHVSEVEFLRSLEEIADTDADLALLAHELLAAGPAEFRLEIARRWREDPDPFWVIIDAPYRARVTYQSIGADIAVDFGTAAFELSSRIRALLRRAQTERDRSPLTGLPGNAWLWRFIRARLDHGDAVALVMADIDDFKGYNDRYGHLAGDDLILLLAGVLREAAQRHGAFLAHVGGDDFCAVCRPDAAARFEQQVVTAFESGRRELPVRDRPTITVASTNVAPEEAYHLHGAFERLAALRITARGG